MPKEPDDMFRVEKERIAASRLMSEFRDLPESFWTTTEKELLYWSETYDMGLKVPEMYEMDRFIWERAEEFRKESKGETHEF